MEELKQKYGNRPDLIAIVDEAIAVTDGEYTGVMVKAYSCDAGFAHELETAVLPLVAQEV